MMRNKKGQFLKGYKPPSDFLEKNRAGHLGRTHTPETKAKIKENNVKYWLGKPGNQRGSEHWNWRGGITPINTAIRQSHEYRKWRREVFKRDDFTCVWCGVRGGILHADHIKPFAFYPLLRFELSNGRTLCKPCHMKTPTYQNRWYNKPPKLTNMFTNAPNMGK